MHIKRCDTKVCLLRISLLLDLITVKEHCLVPVIGMNQKISPLCDGGHVFASHSNQWSMLPTTFEGNLDISQIQKNGQMSDPTQNCM